jgi:ankyrin repeat protein
VDSKDSHYGQTPLPWAAGNGHEAVVKLRTDYASRIGREYLGFNSQWAVESCRDPALILNESLRTVADGT